ncbi:MAG: metallophosphoesterase family protein [Gemmatimonadetes bacterium]|nr:metallophosphoesterase family protein [Gemmatimonadota bacterium]
MKYAIVSDIHGNLEAFKAALDSIREEECEKLICLGDVIGYGANPVECLELARDQCDVILMGNHDAAAAGETSTDNFTLRAQLSTEWTRKQLKPEHLDAIRALPYTWNTSSIFTVHASPYEPKEWHYVLNTAYSDEAFDCFEEFICFVGHSHVPALFSASHEHTGIMEAGELDLSADDRYIVNVGSVGQPRDGDPRLSYCLYDSRRKTIEICRVEYDVETASNKILDVGLPDELAKRLFFGM